MFVPFIAIGSSLLAAVKGVHGVFSSRKRMQRQQERYENRYLQYKMLEDLFNNDREHVKQQLVTLGNLRQDALETVAKVVEFLKTAKIKNRELLENIELTQQQLDEWENITFRVPTLLKGVAESTAIGIGAAYGLYGAVGFWASASTGTAISSLTGAAYTNATLAWLGGGALSVGGGGMALGTIVFNSVIVGPALLAGSFFIGRKVEHAITEVEKKIAELDIAEMHIKRHRTYLDAVVQRIIELKQSTVEMNHELTEILRIADFENKKDIFTIVKMTKSLTNLLDIHVMDTIGDSNA